MRKTLRLHAFNTLEHAAAWLAEQTSRPWTPRDLLELEHGLTLHIWRELDHPTFPAKMRDGTLIPHAFSNDVQRLAQTGRGSMTMTIVDDKVYKFTPGLPFTVEEVRVKREEVQRIALQVTPPVAEQPQEWPAEARQIADKEFDRDTRNNCRDSLLGYAKRVEAKMRELGIGGPHGPLTHGNIMREALQGEKWWLRKRNSSGKSGK